MHYRPLAQQLSHHPRDHNTQKLHRHYQHVDMYRRLILTLWVLDASSIVVCFTMLGVVTKSTFLWFPGAVTILDFIVFIWVQLSMQLWVDFEDPRNTDNKGLVRIEEYLDSEVEFMFCSLWGRRTVVTKDGQRRTVKSLSPIPVWRRWKIVRLCLLLILVSRPVALNRSYFLPPVNSSSCSRDTDGPNSIYNPEGYFPRANWDIYRANTPYVFCVLGRTWAWPTKDHYVKGFELTPPATLECDTQEVGGYVDVNGQCSQENPFPDPTLGLKMPVAQLQNTSEDSNRLCPGNQLGSVCIVGGKASTNCQGQSQIVSGRPEFICPLCLNYWRTVVSQTGTTVTEFGYEKCDLSGGSGSSLEPLCYFCPGLGYGWLADEVVSAYSFTVMYWVSLVFNVFVPLLEILWWWLGIEYIKFNRRKKREKE